MYPNNTIRYKKKSKYEILLKNKNIILHEKLKTLKIIIDFLLLSKSSSEVTVQDILKEIA